MRDQLPGQVGLGGSHHRGDQAMSELCQPGDREVEEDPAGAVQGARAEPGEAPQVAATALEPGEEPRGAATTVEPADPFWVVAMVATVWPVVLARLPINIF